MLEGSNELVAEPASIAHAQLEEDVAFQCVRDNRREIAKEHEMSMDRPADAGNGALFKNTSKEKPSHPNYKGDCTINGKKFWMSAWIKEGAKGKYMSLAFRPAEDKDEKPNAAAKAKAQAPAEADPF